MPWIEFAVREVNICDCEIEAAVANIGTQYISLDCRHVEATKKIAHWNEFFPMTTIR